MDIKDPEDKSHLNGKRGKGARSLLASDRVEHYKTIHADFVSPFDFLLLSLNGLDKHGNSVDIDLKTKVECAKAAVPFTNPKLSSMELQQDNSQEMSEKEKEDKIKELMANPALAALFAAETQVVPGKKGKSA